MVAIAVEDQGPQKVGRIRLRHVLNGKAAQLNAFIGSAVEPGSLIITDDWGGYAQLDGLGYRRATVSPDQLKLPHLVASLLKRWLLGTYQGAVRPSHLEYYLDEFTFRFNRRRSRSRGKLFYRLVQQALMVDPLPRCGFKAQTPVHDDLDILEN
jgi:transposase-like protein